MQISENLSTKIPMIMVGNKTDLQDDRYIYYEDAK